MPTYEYRCEACGHQFEKFQSIISASIRKCPKCGRKKVKRLISTGAGLLFKGSGFYITDYRSPAYAEKAKSESGSAGAGESKPADAAKSETKPADSKPAETKPHPKHPPKESRHSPKHGDGKR
jgi:putative FmdB family regulatory protein